MRIVHIVRSDRFAGVERFLSRLAPALAAAGHEVVVAGGDPRAMRAALGDAVEHRPAVGFAQALRAIGSLRGVDVVDAHMTDAELLAVMRTFGHRVPVVATRHFAAGRGRPALRPLLAGIGRRVAAQIAVSRFVADSIEGRAHVVHPGLHDADGAAERERTVLVAQRLEREKDTATAVRAWARSEARHAGWRLAIAGDGAQRAELESLAVGLGAADTVDFLGHRDDVPELMARAGALLAPTPREGFGLSVVEAMARATPVLASAAGGHLETVGAVAGDLLFAPGDDVAAARRLDALVADAAARRDLGQALQRHQRREFSLPAQARGTLAVYEAVVAR